MYVDPAVWREEHKHDLHLLTLLKRSIEKRFGDTPYLQEQRKADLLR